MNHVEKLSARQRAILAFEERSWRGAHEKAKAVRKEFSLSLTRYYQELNAALEHPDAVAEAPVLVKRLLQRRSEKLNNLYRRKR